MIYTNTSNIGLPLAVWLAADGGYDLTFDPNVISATTLLHSAKSIVLSRRLQMSADGTAVTDIADLIPARLGTAVHENVERAWLNQLDSALESLGYSYELIERIKINPLAVDGDDIPVYIEQRTNKPVGRFTVSGKFDFVIDGTVTDIKTTKTYNWINGSNKRNYQLQGSIYRWLNPDIVTDDHMVIEYIFTDWSPIQAQVDNTYPQHRSLSQKIPLLTLEQTEDYVQSKLSAVEAMEDMDQLEMTPCTPKELWQDPPKWAYYKDPSKTKRATRLYDLAADAYIHQRNDGGQGIVVERPAEPVFCRYCKARPICLQAEHYINQGLLKI